MHAAASRRARGKILHRSAPAQEAATGPPQVDSLHARSYAGPNGWALEAEEHGLRDRDSVTASEFSFLALGLVLGLVTGAALIELFRARPPSSHDVRLTVAHDALPRASALLIDAWVARPRRPRPLNVERTCDMNGRRHRLVGRRWPVRSRSDLAPAVP